MIPNHRGPMLGIALSLLSFNACSSDNNGDEPDVSADETRGEQAQALVIVTEREAPEAAGALHYLHVVTDWPSDGKLDYSQAIELGEPGVAHAQDGSVFVYRPDGTIERYNVDGDLKVTSDTTISFAGYGIDAYDPEPIWVSKDLAFLLDESSAQIARWNPDAMEIEEVFPVDPDVLERGDLKVQFQQGLAAKGRLFTAVNWRNWDTSKAHPVVALGVFDQADPAAGPELIEDEGRCVPSAAVGPFQEDDDGYVYIVGDGGLGFDKLASPFKTDLPQCVLRVPEGGDAYDPDFFVNLQEATGSPSIYTVHPMSDHKLLANIWAPDVDPATVADPADPKWFWELPPYYEYAIVDLEDGTSKKVEDLPRAAIQFSKTLRAGGENYVQLYREDRGSTLQRVSTDGSVTQVLDSSSGTDVQYVGTL